MRKRFLLKFFLSFLATPTLLYANEIIASRTLVFDITSNGKKQNSKDWKRAD